MTFSLRTLLRTSVLTMLVALCAGFVVSTFAPNTASAQMGGNDPRKATTIQTTTAKLGKVNDGLTIRYLNLPWGPTTFGYMENGGNQYYSKRTWPLAHFTLKAKADFFGKTLEPGDYVLVITPKGLANEMGMQIGSFTPKGENGTYLVPGNVFTDTPEFKTVAAKPVKFASGAPMSDTLKFNLAPKGNKIEIRIHYGDRLYVDTMTAAK